MYSDVSARVSRKRVFIGFAATLLVAVILVNLPSGPLGSSPALGNSGAATLAKPFTPSGAIHIPNAGPVLSLVKGDRVNVTFEYEAVNWTPSLAGTVLRFPTVDGVFTQPGGNLVFIPVIDRDTVLTHSGFSNGTNTRTSEIMTKSFTLDPTVEPFLTTLKLAIMANVTYGTFTLAVRWNYSIWIQANDTTFSSGFSRFGSGGGQESSIIPAPLIVLGNTTPEYTTVGSLFTAQLTGLVSGADFWVEVEDPFTGIAVEHVWDNASVGATEFNVSILLQEGHGTMAAAPWLVHIHDNEKQILYSIPVYLSDPAIATVHFKISPTTCGPIVFNGLNEASGKATHVATNQSYNLSAPSCAGYTFGGWSQSGGGAQISSPASANTTANIVYNNTIIANYA